MTQSHLWIAPETTEGTFVTPSGDAMSNLQTFTIAPGENRIERRESGRGQGITDMTPGIHAPSGSGTIGVEPDNMVRIAESAGFNTITSTQVAATSAYTHGMTIDDSAALAFLSMQAQQRYNAVTETLNIRGGKIGDLTFNLSVGNLMTCDFTWMGWEVREDGVNFADGNSSPAAVSPAYGTIVRTFQYDDAEVKLGGTATLDGPTQIFSTDGTASDFIEDISISITQNNVQRHTVGNRYPRGIISGDRTITGSMTVRNDSPAVTYFQKVRDATQEPIIITMTNPDANAIESGQTYEMSICLPRVDYSDSNAWGDLSMNSGAKTVTLNFTAVIDETSGLDIGISFKNTTTSYA